MARLEFIEIILFDAAIGGVSHISDLAATHELQLSVYKNAIDRTISAMHCSLVALLHRSCHMIIKYSNGTCLLYYICQQQPIVDLDHNMSNDYKPMSNDTTLMLLRNHKIINFMLTYVSVIYNSSKMASDLAVCTVSVCVQ
jgi:hypothetical protein